MTVFVCVHREIMDIGNGPMADDYVMKVASSQERAEAFMKRAGVDSWSWWELYEYPVDGPDDADYGVLLGKYGPRGGKVKANSDCWGRALAAYNKRPKA